MGSILTGDFFAIRSIQDESGKVNAVLTLNASHTIFSGHFPGQPVVPGACLLQMLKEIMEEVTRTTLQLSKANSLKFLAPIDPGKNSEIEFQATFSTEDNQLTVNATFLYDAPSRR